MRRLLVAGNWKMNLNISGAESLIRELLAGLRELPCDRVDVVVCPPFVYLFPVAQLLRQTTVGLGAQDLYFEPQGAFTGEVSGPMIAETGAKYVIIGHSERRHTIGHLEDDRMVNLKLRAAQKAGLTPILCVGETLAERQAGQTLDVLTFQLTAGLVNIMLERPDDLVIAYEPVWAIGTGHNATPQQAQEAHAHLRRELRRLAGPIAESVRILYGGSIRPENAGELMSQPDVDGGLVGGASLKAASFLKIIRAALAAKSSH
jgi:triosephosphate isomerase